VELPGGHKIGEQAIQAVNEITVLEEYAKLNNLTGIITVASGLTAMVADLSLTVSADGTYVWIHLEEECPRALVQLYRGLSSSSITGPPHWRVGWPSWRTS
jgi:hypothetical protein